MTLRQKLLRFGSPARVAVLAASICACSLCPNAYGDDPKAVPEAPRDSPPIQTSPPAKFFTINGVLEKLDRAQGRGKAAIRLASLRPSSTVMDARSLPSQVSAGGTEPFGLFTFRAPEGLLSRKWRGLQSDILKEEKVLDRCRTDASDCPSYAAQFLRLINAIKSKSGRSQLEEANAASTRLSALFRIMRNTARPTTGARRLPPLRRQKEIARTTRLPNTSRCGMPDFRVTICG